MNYRLKTRFYFPDGDYIEPQELLYENHEHEEERYVAERNENYETYFEPHFVELNTEFFEKVEEESAMVNRAGQVMCEECGKAINVSLDKFHNFVESLKDLNPKQSTKPEKILKPINTESLCTNNAMACRINELIERVNYLLDKEDNG